MIWTDEKKELARKACLLWAGTPHANNIAIRKVGIDCVHFVCDVLEKSGTIQHQVIPRYSPKIGFRGAEKILIAEFSKRIPVEHVTKDYQFGDVLIFNPRVGCNHLAILIDSTVWHSRIGIGVSGNPLSDFRKSIIGAMRLK